MATRNDTTGFDIFLQTAVEGEPIYKMEFIGHFETYDRAKEYVDMLADKMDAQDISYNMDIQNNATSRYDYGRTN